ncbi:MAG TPA: malectin [Candidatus Acidoferrales bacterium]|nr:malectin [Candidatus Acidoferrales bacterium]
MPQFDPPKPGRHLPHWIYLACLTAFSFALYWEMFTYNTFGPETPLFYVANDLQPFRQILRSYTYMNLMWYRPTAFGVPYWVIEQFVGWHNLVAWKFLHFWTAIAAGCAIYWLVVRCLGGSQLAGLLSAVYFMAQPSLYAAAMEAAGFDFLHILLTVLCAGAYLLGTRATGRRSVMLTALAWLLFLVSITTKEIALATPGYLLIVSILVTVFERRDAPTDAPLGPRIRRELLRLLPFFALLPVYYFIHVTKIPGDTFAGSGRYRSAANWGIILANLRKFPLWIVRIYAWSDQTLSIRMYQSTALNNTVGICGLLLVAVQWRRRVRMAPSSRLVLLLMLAWIAVYLVLPVFSGGFVWHINLIVVGYSVLFGLALAWCFEAMASAPLRRAAIALFLGGGLWLGRADLKIELYAGSHATGFHINHSVIPHPPVAAGKLGKEPLIYIEDRLGMGPWWYGCYGSLFKFAYLRHDLEEVIVPQMASVPRDLRRKWLAHKNAFFFRYDADYNWHDATREFRDASLAPGAIQPGQACGAPGRQVQFALEAGADSEVRRVAWSIDPPGSGAISQSGLYTAPHEARPGTVQIMAGDPADRNSADRTPADRTDHPWSARALLTFGSSAPIRIAAGREKPIEILGRVWGADANYEGGHPYASTSTVLGTPNPELYQNERFAEGPLVYRFCVLNGAYTVKLKFAETWFAGPGKRIFDVFINGAPVLARFDIAAAAGGPNRAIDRGFRTRVTDGQIAIQFRPVVSNPKVSAIEIVP